MKKYDSVLGTFHKQHVYPATLLSFLQVKNCYSTMILNHWSEILLFLNTGLGGAWGCPYLY